MPVYNSQPNPPTLSSQELGGGKVKFFIFRGWRVRISTGPTGDLLTELPPATANTDYSAQFDTTIA